MKRLIHAIAFGAIAAAAVIATGSAKAVPCEEFKVDVLPFPAADQVPWDRRAYTLRDLSEPRKLVFGQFETERYAMFDPVTCTLSIGYKHPIIYIASDLGADACVLDHILVHERKHAQTRVVATARWPSTLPARIKEIGPHAAAREAFEAVSAENREIDSFEEYETSRDACEGAIPRLGQFKWPQR